MARGTASAKWAAGPALDGQRDMPLGLSLNELLGSAVTWLLHDDDHEHAMRTLPKRAVEPDDAARSCS